MDRATPVQQRKALEIAHLFAKAGAPFVCVPVANEVERERLQQQAMDRFEYLIENADSEDIDPGCNLVPV